MIVANKPGKIQTDFAVFAVNEPAEETDLHLWWSQQRSPEKITIFLSVFAASESGMDTVLYPRRSQQVTEKYILRGAGES